MFRALARGLYLAVARLRHVADESPPMRRPSVPEADREIGARHPVLTHGYVALVDYMGDDAAIVQAARVSYGQGTKSVRDDRGLIRYLMRHRHTTPFEMVEYKFLVRLPIFVARQWIRHRTACLAEGTRIFFDLPASLRSERPRVYPVPIEQLWRRFQPTRNREIRHQRNPFYRRERIEAMFVRQLNETTWRIDRAHVRAVSQSGFKPVYRMALEDGKSIECTADHRFRFADGWDTLAHKAGLTQVHGLAVWNPGDYELCVNGTEVVRPAMYHDKSWLEEQIVRKGITPREISDACGVGVETVRMWIRRFDLPRPVSTGFRPGNTYYTQRASRRGIPRGRRMTGNGSEPYRSKAWLEARWVTLGLSASAIARECGSSVSAIRKWLKVHGLTHHPHHGLAPFVRGHIPWNKGRTYRLGRRTLTPEHLAILQSTRAGEASNFWKGGVARDRDSIGRWTTQVAGSVHERNGWTCQLCHERKPVLHAHHVIPVWADVSLSRERSNLTTLCDACHRAVHRDELAYIERLGGGPVTAAFPFRPRGHQRRFFEPKLARIAGFEYVGQKRTYDLEVEGPFHNFVANGIVTHNSVNEHSARYSVVPDEFEVPPAEEIRYQSKRNRQGGDERVTPELAERFRQDLDRLAKEAYEGYTRALEAGIARETARLILPVAYYTQWYWKIDLWNLFHFLSLRLDPHAQEEIRLYAAEIAKIARLVSPTAFEAFEEFQLGGLTLSRREQRAVRALLDGKSPPEACAMAGLPLTREDGKPMTTGEGVEFLEKLERIRRLE